MAKYNDYTLTATTRVSGVDVEVTLNVLLEEGDVIEDVTADARAKVRAEIQAINQGN